MNDDSTSTDATAAMLPPKRARRCLAKKVGEPVEVRLSAGRWTTMPKPRSRRGKHYVDHVRAVLAEFESRGIPPTKGNLRRVAAGRGDRLARALAEIKKDSAPPPLVNVEV
jgi:hypothetical protein